MIYIIVPVFKRFEISIRFFNSLKTSSNYKVIIIDDGCEDSYKSFAFNRSNYEYVLGSGSLFWGGAINLGISFIKSNYILTSDDFIVLANDDIILRENSLDMLIESGKIGYDIIHPLVINSEGVCVSSGSKLISKYLFITKHPFRGSHISKIPKNEFFKIDILTGRFLMVRANVFLNFGGIRTEYFQHYGGDSDLGLRLRNKIDCYINSNSIIELDTTTTGNNAGTDITFMKFVNSLFSIRSSNNLRVRVLLNILNFNIFVSLINLVLLLPTVTSINLYYFFKKKYKSSRIVNLK
jgi:N-acetylglucosaminyl-diphospho-decaprenol L-rhamnosyltransferase